MYKGATKFNNIALAFDARFPRQLGESLHTAMEAETVLNKRQEKANTMGRCLMDMNESLQVRNGTSPQGNWREALEWRSYDDGDSRKCLNPPDQIEAFLENAGGGRPWAADDTDLTQADLAAHEIHMGNAELVRQAQRPIPLALRTQVLAMLQEYLEK
ncbi:unnamed protein product [Gongylonema pulchrum]|uniref:Integrase n=1 Tax=Gongylonema pulchrum TaxID=637853 RepID=A0A183E8M8_9BILA|nr:unnamed protein product [Gongylonema pulchrum]